MIQQLRLDFLKLVIILYEAMTALSCCSRVVDRQFAPCAVGVARAEAVTTMMLGATPKAHHRLILLSLHDRMIHTRTHTMVQQCL